MKPGQDEQPLVIKKPEDLVNGVVCSRCRAPCLRRERFMSLAEFLPHLFDHGEVRFREPPAPSDRGREQAQAILAGAFASYWLDVAGSPIAFDEEIALSAAKVVQKACWYLVNRNEPDEQVMQALKMEAPPDSASAHLSGDLAFRYLTHIHRRARALKPSDVVVSQLADILRRWPLSGVQSDVDEPPLTPLEFARHDGLMLLYAERFVRRPKPAWRPGKGRLLEFVELVETQLERPHAGP